MGTPQRDCPPALGTGLVLKSLEPTHSLFCYCSLSQFLFHLPFFTVRRTWGRTPAAGECGRLPESYNVRGRLLGPRPGLRTHEEGGPRHQEKRRSVNWRIPLTKMQPLTQSSASPRLGSVSHFFQRRGLLGWAVERNLSARGPER